MLASRHRKTIDGYGLTRLTHGVTTLSVARSLCKSSSPGSSKTPAIFGGNITVGPGSASAFVAL
jgi:hypothetical protein